MTPERRNLGSHTKQYFGKTIMNSGIYSIVNTANGKRYIGQSVCISIRKQHHFTELKAGRHYNEHLQASWHKYGGESFEWHVLEECHEDMLDARESSWISYHKSDQPSCGYNKETGGHKDKHATPETRQKLSNLLKGKKRSESFCKKISASRKGWVMSEDQKAKLRLAWIERKAKGMGHTNLGRKFSEEAKEKMSLAKIGKSPWNKGLKLSPDHINRMCKNGTGKKQSEETILKRNNSRALTILKRREAQSEVAQCA